MIKYKKNYLETKINEENSGIKLYTFLRHRLSLSAEKIKSLKFDPDGLFVNGERSETVRILHKGDLVRVCLSDSVNRDRKIIANGFPLNILYEDIHLIVVNKPSGVVCHPSKGHLIDSLANALRARFDETQPDANIHFVGRLDKETSGIVVIAKNSVAAEKICGFHKEYTAIVKGHMPESFGEIRVSMAEERDPETGILKMAASEDGKAAVTFYEVIKEREDYSVLKVRIETGRMHQIRFHMAQIGHPLLGDTLYGEGDIRINRCALHAGKVSFQHPFSRETICLLAEIPVDMQALI